MADSARGAGWVLAKDPPCLEPRTACKEAADASLFFSADQWHMHGELRVVIIPNISVSLTITTRLCQLIMDAYLKSASVKMELFGRGELSLRELSGKEVCSLGSCWLSNASMGPGSYSQILVDTNTSSARANVSLTYAWPWERKA